MQSLALRSSMRNVSFSGVIGFILPCVRCDQAGRGPAVRSDASVETGPKTRPPHPPLEPALSVPQSLGQVLYQGSIVRRINRLPAGDGAELPSWLPWLGNEMPS